MVYRLVKMKLLIVGGGSTTEMLLKDPLIREMVEGVIVIENNPERKTVLERIGDIYVVERDATDTSIYSSINMREITAVIATTSSDEVNFLVLAIAKTYNIPIRIGIFKDEKIGEVARNLRLGIPIIRPSITAGLLKQALSSIIQASEMGLFPITSEYRLYRVTIKEDDPVEGWKLEELRLEEEDAYVVMIFDGRELVSPSPDIQIFPGYTLFIVAKNNGFLKRIKGI